MDKILEGTFIRLVPLASHHAEVVVKWRNSDSAKYINRGSSTVDEQVKWINSRPSSEFNFVIVFQDKPVGQISLYDISHDHRTANSGRLILDSNVPKGIPITFEAILLVHRLAFYDLRLNKVSGIVAGNNIGVVKLNDFIKMKREGVLRQHFIFNSSPQDGIVFGLLRDEFLKEQEPLLSRIVRLARGNPTQRAQFGD